MKDGFKKLFRLLFSSALITPVILISIYLAMFIFLKGAMPTTEEIIAHFASLYERYGYEIIFLGAALEALLLVNLFVPGSTAVALGAVFARSGQVDLTLAVIAASSGAILGYLIDFALGYLGFGEIIKKLGYGDALSKTRRKVEKSSVKTFALGFIHPNIGAVVALVAGIVKMKVFNFIILSSLSTLIWVSFWGLVIFALGDIFLVVLTRYFFILVIMVMSLWILSVLYGKSKEVTS